GTAGDGCAERDKDGEHQLQGLVPEDAWHNENSSESGRSGCTLTTRRSCSAKRSAFARRRIIAITSKGTCCRGGAATSSPPITSGSDCNTASPRSASCCSASAS